MKRRNRVLYVLLISLFLTCLAACDHVTPTDPPQSTPGEYLESPKPAELPTTDWQASKSITSNPFTLSRNGAFFLSNSCLCFLDTDTGYSVFLCSKPGCRHGESDTLEELKNCDAFLDGIPTMLFCVEDSLYYTVFDAHGTHLYARNADGSGLRKIATLCAGFITKETTAAINSWCVFDGYLYYNTMVEGSVLSETGDLHVERLFETLMRLNLSNGKEEELLRTQNEVITMIGVNEGMVLLQMRESISMEGLDYDEYREQIKQLPLFLRLWCEDRGSVATLCELNRENAYAIMGFADGQLHFSKYDYNGVYAYDFATGTAGNSKLPNDTTSIWNERFAGVYLDGYYDLETGEFLPSAFDSLPMPEGIDSISGSIIHVGDTGIIIGEFYSKNHNPVFDEYAYVPIDKMDDGIQLSDRIVFMRQDDEGSVLLQPEA